MKLLCFVISHKPDNRYMKRINALKDLFHLHVIFWNKTNIKVNLGIDGINIHEIMIPANQTNPLRRIPELIRFIYAAYNELKMIVPDVVYVGNLDMLYIARKYKLSINKNLKIIYEIADLHRLIVDKQRGLRVFISKVLKYTERIYTKDVSLLVLTSMKFYNFYYSSFFPKYKVVFLPNMPEDNVFNGYIHKDRTGKQFTIGFIGWIRYKEQLKMLIDVASKKKCRVLFAGSDGDGTEFEDYCKKFSHVDFLGAFDYEKSIRDLYDLVDCVYAVYDASWTNVRIALPNKLYEAIACETPIIVSKNTYLSELVEEMGIGVSVSHDNSHDLELAIDNLMLRDSYYKSMVRNCKIQKKKQSCKEYTNVLVDKIMNIVGENI